MTRFLTLFRHPLALLLLVCLCLVLLCGVAPACDRVPAAALLRAPSCNYQAQTTYHAQTYHAVREYRQEYALAYPLSVLVQPTITVPVAPAPTPAPEVPAEAPRARAPEPQAALPPVVIQREVQVVRDYTPPVVFRQAAYHYAPQQAVVRHVQHAVTAFNVARGVVQQRTGILQRLRDNRAARAAGRAAQANVKAANAQRRAAPRVTVPAQQVFGY